MRRNLQRWFALAVLGFTLVLAGACGGDDDDDGGGAGAGAGTSSGSAGNGTTKEPCASPGYTETGCSCADSALGRRTCGSNHFWGECACPPVTQQCVEGEKVRCNPCSGETEGKLTVCLQGGTYDCGCD